jgi:hypothetical protein
MYLLLCRSEWLIMLLDVPIRLPEYPAKRGRADVSIFEQNRNEKHHFGSQQQVAVQ